MFAGCSKRLTTDALDEVAIMRCRQVLLADGESDSRTLKTIRSHDRHKKTAAITAAELKRCVEFFRLQQSGRARKRARHEAKPDARLRDQLVTALRTTTVDHGATVLRGHAGAKSMGARFLELTGLKCALHGVSNETCEEKSGIVAA